MHSESFSELEWNCSSPERPTQNPDTDKLESTRRPLYCWKAHRSNFNKSSVTVPRNDTFIIFYRDIYQVFSCIGGPWRMRSLPYSTDRSVKYSYLLKTQLVSHTNGRLTNSAILGVFNQFRSSFTMGVNGIFFSLNIEGAEKSTRHATNISNVGMYVDVFGITSICRSWHFHSLKLNETNYLISLLQKRKHLN